MKTFHIITPGGYREVVYGRGVNLHIEFRTWQHTYNNKFQVRCGETGLILGTGDTLTEAKGAALKYIREYGVSNLRKDINKIIKNHGPGKGGKKQ